MNSTSQWSDLLVKHIAYINKCAKSFAQDFESANDLTQDVLLLALQNENKFNPVDGNLKAWLSVLTRNLFINQYRRNKKYRLQVEMSAKLCDSGLLAHSTQNNGPSDLNHSDLYRDINGMRPGLRFPLLARAEGGKYEEIADDLDIPLGTVRSRLRRGRQNLNPRRYR